MNTHRDDPDNHPDLEDEADGLASIERPPDDPQTRPALDPEVDVAERKSPDDS